MDFHGITIMGLGPGDVNLLTLQAWRLLESIPEIYVRTRQLPVVEALPESLAVYSFDDLYEKSETFDAVYTAIVSKIIELGRRPEGVIYAVPGHPFVAEATSPEIIRRAQQEGIPVRVIEGLSFLEPAFTALGIDPLPGTTILDAMELASAHVPPFPPDRPAIIAQIHSKAIAAEVKLTLMEIYPDKHPVQFVHAAGTPEVVVEILSLYEIDRSDKIGLLTALYLPPLNPGTSFEDFQEIIAHLRAPDGCPWDKEQTHQSLRPHLLEETYEVLNAIDRGDPAAMSEEFGDLLLQIVLHAQIASEEGEYRMTDVIQGIFEKIVRRHPHVFSDVQIKDAQGVIQNWERLKETERNEKGKTESGLMESVPLALPALVQAQTYQERAARVGFDWQEIQGVYAKLNEEMEEVRSAQDDQSRAAEIGDLLFAVVNLARWSGVDAESVLR
ncbi:MAG: nucleoside triphosphate pyrophosphohydrolase, partial [Omnitrophica WOR_2 bacterium]